MQGLERLGVSTDPPERVGHVVVAERHFKGVVGLGREFGGQFAVESQGRSVLGQGLIGAGRARLQGGQIVVPGSDALGEIRLGGRVLGERFPDGERSVVSLFGLFVLMKRHADFCDMGQRFGQALALIGQLLNLTGRAIKERGRLLVVFLGLVVAAQKTMDVGDPLVCQRGIEDQRRIVALLFKKFLIEAQGALE